MGLLRTRPLRKLVECPSLTLSLCSMRFMQDEKCNVVVTPCDSPTNVTCKLVYFAQNSSRLCDADLLEIFVED